MSTEPPETAVEMAVAQMPTDPAVVARQRALERLDIEHVRDRIKARLLAKYPPDEMFLSIFFEGKLPDDGDQADVARYCLLGKYLEI